MTITRADYLNLQCHDGYVRPVALATCAPLAPRGVRTLRRSVRTLRRSVRAFLRSVRMHPPMQRVARSTHFLYRTRVLLPKTIARRRRTHIRTHASAQTQRRQHADANENTHARNHSCRRKREHIHRRMFFYQSTSDSARIDLKCDSQASCPGRLRGGAATMVSGICAGTLLALQHRFRLVKGAKVETCRSACNGTPGTT